MRSSIDEYRKDSPYKISRQITYTHHIVLQIFIYIYCLMFFKMVQVL